MNSTDHGFPGLAAYFNAETVMLEKSGMSLEKTFMNNGKQERIIINNPDWKKELRPFTEIITVHPATLKSFIIDSLSIGAAKIIKYTSKDERQALKSLAIFTHQNFTDSIVVIKQVANSYYNSTDTLIYRGSGNFRIAAENNPFFGKRIAMIFEGKSILSNLSN